jgi:hypothetical protein
VFQGYWSILEVLAAPIFIAWIIRGLYRQHRIASGNPLEVVPIRNMKLRQMVIALSQPPASGWKTFGNEMLDILTFGDVPYRKFVNEKTKIKGVVVENVNLNRKELDNLAQAHFDENPFMLNPRGRFNHQRFNSKEGKGATVEDWEIFEIERDDADFRNSVSLLVLKYKNQYYRGPWKLNFY